MKPIHGYATRNAVAPEYRAWIKMKTRCKATTGKGWDSYGSRGIKVCAKWATSFLGFLEDMGPKPTPSHTLDRLDNDKGYEPSNCKWSTRHEQDRNKRSTVWVKFNGKSYCQKDFADIFGVTDATIIAKLKKGWTVYQIVDYYEEKHKKKYRTNTLTLKDALTSLGEWFHSGRGSFIQVGKLEDLVVSK